MDKQQIKSSIFGSVCEQELLTSSNKRKITIGIPSEVKEEKRILLTPESISLLKGLGFDILIEKNAGRGVSYSDMNYAEAGAEIVHTKKEVFQADIIVKVLPPTEEEAGYIKDGALLLSLLELESLQPEVLRTLMRKHITAIGYELMKSPSGRRVIQDIIDEVEGATSIILAAELLTNKEGGKGILLGAIPGVSPPEVVVIGAGTAGIAAARSAIALGSLVRLFDDDIEKLRYAHNLLGNALFTSNFHPLILERSFCSADIIIGDLGDFEQRRNYLIDEDLMNCMKKGAIVLDLSITRGGCFDTTLSIFFSGRTRSLKNGVLHFCEPHISRYVARSLSMVLSNIMVPLLTDLYDLGTTKEGIRTIPEFRTGCYLYCGRLVNTTIGNKFGFHCNSVDLFLTVY